MKLPQKSLRAMIAVSFAECMYVYIYMYLYIFFCVKLQLHPSGPPEVFQ